MPWLQSKYILYRIVLKHNNEIGLEVRTYSAKKYKKLNEGLNVLMLSSHDIVYVWRETTLWESVFALDWFLFNNFMYN